MQVVVITFLWLCIGAIIYAYAGYPLLLWALARLKPAPSFPETDPPQVTLLIAAYNEEQEIAGKLENSLGLDYPRERLQILVAADGSDDRTPEVVKGFSDRGVELSFHPERRGKMAAIENALRHARGTIVVLSDANNKYDPQVIRKLVAPFVDPKVGAVGGSKVIVQDVDNLSTSEGLYWKYESFIKRQETRLSSCVATAGEILAFRREIIELPKRRVINDDAYIALQVLRNGYRIHYEPAARSYEPASLAAHDEFERRARIIAGRYEVLLMIPLDLLLRRPVVMWQWMSHKLVRPLVPFAMIGALAANTLLVLAPPRDGGWFSLAPPIGVALLGAQLGFYGLAWIGGRLRIPGVIGKLLYLPSFLLHSNLAALAGLYRYVTGRQTAQWRRAARRRG